MASQPEVASFIRATFRSVWALELLGFHLDLAHEPPRLSAPPPPLSS